MKLIVFGATGGTGSHVVQQACAAGHEDRSESGALFAEAGPGLGVRDRTSTSLPGESPW